MTIAGPAKAWAAFPVTVKMPAPMMTPIPKTVRSSALSRFLSWYSGSSVSWIDCSIDLVRNTLMRALLDVDGDGGTPGGRPAANYHRPGTPRAAKLNRPDPQA